MRPEDKLSNAIGNIDDKYILEALNYRPHHALLHNTRFMRVSMVADDMDIPTHDLHNARFMKAAMAALCIVVFITVNWCITNISSTEIKLTGSIKTNTQKLLFKDYGDDVIVVDAPCELIIDYYGAEIIEEIYLYNYETNTKTELVKSTHIDFKVNEPGAYIIYAVTKNGIIINLKDYVTIEYGTFNIFE